MALDRAGVLPHELRTEPRDEVHHRARATDLGTGAAFALLVVNMSPHGLMARCEHVMRAGDRLHVTLPAVGVRVAEVRWALGGRVGCQFDQPIALSAYVAALAAML